MRELSGAKEIERELSIGSKRSFSIHRSLTCIDKRIKFIILFEPGVSSL